jgi:hypothetical protein
VAFSSLSPRPAFASLRNRFENVTRRLPSDLRGCWPEEQKPRGLPSGPPTLVGARPARDIHSRYASCIHARPRRPAMRTPRLQLHLEAHRVLPEKSHFRRGKTCPYPSAGLTGFAGRPGFCFVRAGGHRLPSVQDGRSNFGAHRRSNGAHREEMSRAGALLRGGVCAGCLGDREGGVGWRFRSASAGRRRPDEDLATKMPAGTSLFLTATL